MAAKLIFFVTLATTVACILTNKQVEADDKIKKLIKSQGTATIKLIECHVPDLDPFPAQGDSDVFARVYLAGTNATICEWPIVQDTNKPKFESFDCTTKAPIPGDSLIKIDLYDSDKPLKDPDFIGGVKISMSDLIFNQRLDSAENYAIEGQKYPKHYLRAKVSFKPVAEATSA